MLKEKLFIIIIYFVTVIAASFLWMQPYIILLIYIILSAIIFIKWHTRQDFIYYFSPFFFGPLGEIIASSNGAWIYAKPLFIVPIWLPFLWGIAALTLMKLTQLLIKK